MGTDNWGFFFELALCLKTTAVLGHARDDQCAMGLISFAYFMVVTAHMTPLDELVVPFTQTTATPLRCCSGL